jgi:hypothetical protein
MLKSTNSRTRPRKARANPPSRAFPSARSELNDGPAFAGQQVSRLVVPGAAAQLLTTVTTGLIAYSQPLSSAAIAGFSTRFGSTFDEYRIVGAQVRLTPVTPTTGVSKAWFDEKSTSAPTSNESQERTSIPLSNSSSNSRSSHTFRWRAKDLLDLQYSAIGTDYTPVSFKVYTDNASWGSPIAVTSIWILEPIFLIEFRGIKST